MDNKTKLLLIGLLSLGFLTTVSAQTYNTDNNDDTLQQSIFEGFEDQNLNDFVGDKSDFEITTEQVYEGNYALKSTRSADDLYRIIYDSSKELGAGTYSYRNRIDSGGTQLIFLGTEKNTNLNDYYYAKSNEFSFDWYSGLFRFTIGGSTNIDENQISDYGNEWVKVEVEVTESGSVTYRLYDSNDNVLSTTNADAIRNSGYMGIGTLKSGLYYDNLKFEPADPPNQPPNVDSVTPSETSPSNPSYVTGPNTIIDYSISDDNGLDNVLVTRDGTNVVYENDGISGTSYSNSYTKAGPADGSYQYVVTAVDNQGLQTDSQTIYITKDTQAPSVSLQNPADGSSLTSNPTLEVNGNDATTNIDEIRWYVDGNLVHTDDWSSSSVVGETYTPSLSGGQHSWYVEMEDEAGNVATSGTRSFTSDQSPPSVTNQVSSTTQGGSNQTLFGTDLVYFRADLSDDIGLDSATLYTDGTEAISFNVDNNPTTVNYQETFNSGTHTYHWETTDTSGKTTSGPEISFTVDTEAPQFGDPNLWYPQDGQFLLTDSPIINPAPISENVNLVESRIYLDGQLVHTETEDPYFPEYTASGLSEGGHTYYVEAEDSVGNVQTSSTRTFTVDSSPPTVNSFYLNDNGNGDDLEEIVGGDAYTGIDASDQNGLSEVAVYVDGSEYVTLPADQSSWDFSLESLSSGQHDLYWNVTDVAGRSTQTQTHTFTIDSQSPNLDSMLPVGGEWYLDGNVTLEGSFNDNNDITRIEMFLDGTSVKTVNPNSPTGDISYQTNQLSEGSYTWHMEAEDEAGNTEDSPTRTFNIDKTNPTVSLDFTQTSTDEGDLIVEASDNNIDTVEVFRNGNLEEDTVVVGSDTFNEQYSFDDVQESDQFSVTVTDQAGRTNSTSLSPQLDQENPEIENTNLTVTSGTDRPVWNSTYEATINVSDNNDIGSVKVQLVADQKLTEYVSASSPSDNNTISLDPTNYYNEAYLRDRRGELSLNVDVQDSVGNSRTYTSIETELFLDTYVDFQNWRAVADLGETSFDFSFDSNDNLTSIETDIFLLDDTPSLNFSVGEELPSCGTFSSEECLQPIYNSYNISITNPTSQPQTLIYEGEETGITIEDGSTITIYSQAVQGEEANVSTDFVDQDNDIYRVDIGYENQLSFPNYQDRFDTRIIYGELSESEWTRTNGDLWTYESSETLPNPANYVIELELEDQYDNNRTVTKTERIRPDTALGSFYQTFANSGMNPLYAGLLILFIVPLVSLIAELKSFGSTLLSQGISILWAVFLLMFGVLEAGASIIAIMMGAGLFVKNLRDFVAGGE